MAMLGRARTVAAALPAARCPPSLPAPLSPPSLPAPLSPPSLPAPLSPPSLPAALASLYIAALHALALPHHLPVPRSRLPRVSARFPSFASAPHQCPTTTTKPTSPSRVLVVGSGGLSIGQAGEFDYSGSQAIKALREERVQSILVNPNIATIQTSLDLADVVYFLPISPDAIELVIQKERPDAILLAFGGQSALNVGVALAASGSLARLGVSVLGTQPETLQLTEDRHLFANALRQINIPIAPSIAVSSVADALDAANSLAYPVIVRSAYALGGLGSGFASSPDALRQLATASLALAPQILVERSLKGWKEIEYEVVRDAKDNCITVCNMENFDPLGIHTGDSIVVAPSQTLSDQEYHMLRSAAIKIVRHLNVVGECNVQYALNPNNLEFAVIEVNARLSRSSALASKATGYPLAFVAAKIALGATLPDLKNAVTKSTTANFEPSLDYVVTKIPKWDLAKFNLVGRNIGSSMKSVGEVMAIGRSWEESLQKAVRMIDPKFVGFQSLPFDNLDHALANPTDLRLFAVAHALLDKQYSVDRIHKLTNIDKWFLYKLENIARVQKELQNVIGSASSTSFSFTASSSSSSDLSDLSGTTNLPALAAHPDLLKRAKQAGFSDLQIARLIGAPDELAVRRTRKALGIVPYVKRIDTLAAEFPAETNYLYTTYNASTNDVSFDDRGIVVLGSGVYRIGSSVEFDWCGVSCIRALRSLGRRTVMINYNPETVSTDFDECDRLYFEELSLERVLDIYELENASGCVVSVGGQLPQNIALKLEQANSGVRVLGTSPVDVDRAEDRNKFSRALDAIGVDQPEWRALTSAAEAAAFCDSVGYPVLVRPSYVLSGAAMSVVRNAKDLESRLNAATTLSPEHPVVITKFIQGAQELDVDAVAVNGRLLVYAVSQHIENAGVHSGDASLVLPPVYDDDAPPVHGHRVPGIGVRPLNDAIITDAKRIAEKVAREFCISGPFNMQLILSREPWKSSSSSSSVGQRDTASHSLKVIECNLRASRSFPFVSKVLGTNFIQVATHAMIANHQQQQQQQQQQGQQNKDNKVMSDLLREYGDQDLMQKTRHARYKAVKAPVFSWTRLAGADPMLGVEMASTGEVACFGRDMESAYLTAMSSNHNNFRKLPMSEGSGVVVSVDLFSDERDVVYVVERLMVLGYRVYGDDLVTVGVLKRHGVRGVDTVLQAAVSNNGCVKQLPASLVSAAKAIDCAGDDTTGVLLIERDAIVSLYSDRRVAKAVFDALNIEAVFSLCGSRPQPTTTTSSPDMNLIEMDTKYLVRRTGVDLGLGLMNESKSAVVLVDGLWGRLRCGRSEEESVRSWREWIDDCV